MTHWRYEVDAGAHPRRQCPLWLPFDPAAGFPTLRRTGRERPVRCQLDVRPSGIAVAFLLAAAKPGERKEYTLATGERQRQSAARVCFISTAAGWVGQISGHKVVEMLLPTEGASTLTCWRAGRRWARIVTPISGRGAQPQLRPVRVAEVLHRDGSLFGQVSARYRNVSASGVTLFDEERSLRLWDREDEPALLELYVTLSAVGGPLRFVDSWSIGHYAATPDKETPLAAFCPPKFEIELCGVASPNRITSDRGLIGASEIAGKSAPALAIGSGGGTLAVIPDPANPGGAPRWEFPAPSVVVAHARINPDWQTGEGALRLPLGCSLRLGWRLFLADMEFNDNDLRRQANQWESAPAIVVKTDRPGR